MLTAEQIIKTLGLVPLKEEGGMMLRTYESEERAGTSPAATAIYYLLSGNAFSHLHRLSADEIYHFYLGDPVDLYYIDSIGSVTHIVLGQNLLSGQVPQAVVPKGTWQGSRLAEGGTAALLGTTMSPGFTQESYEHANAEEILLQFPELEDVVRLLTGPVTYC